MVKRPTIATVAVALLLTGCGLFDRDVATTTSLPSSPTSTSTAQSSTAPTEATTSTTSSSTTTSVAPTSSSTTADPPEPAGVEVFLGVLRPTSGGLWAVPVGVSNVALPTPESFPRIRRVEPDEVGGLVVETTRGKVYHFPSGGRAPRELVLPGTWFGMGTLGGEPVVLVEAVDWLDADFVYDCEGDPCLPGFDYVVGTGRQIFSRSRSPTGTSRTRPPRWDVGTLGCAGRRHRDGFGFNRPAPRPTLCDNFGRLWSGAASGVRAELARIPRPFRRVRSTNLPTRRHRAHRSAGCSKAHTRASRPMGEYSSTGLPTRMMPSSLSISIPETSWRASWSPLGMVVSRRSRHGGTTTGTPSSLCAITSEEHQVRSRPS